MSSTIRLAVCLACLVLGSSLRADVIEIGVVANGADFLYVPDTYYDTLSDRVGTIDEALPALQELGILVDRDDRHLRRCVARDLRSSQADRRRGAAWTVHAGREARRRSDGRRLSSEALDAGAADRGQTADAGEVR